MCISATGSQASKPESPRYLFKAHAGPHMKPLNPLNAPLPLTLSEEASSEAFLSFGFSLMFCAPPVD
jgi:hypothetical protein